MSNNDNGIQTDITANGEKRETVKSFKYLGAIVLNEGSKPEVLARTAMKTATLAKLNSISTVWVSGVVKNTPNATPVCMSYEATKLALLFTLNSI